MNSSLCSLCPLWFIPFLLSAGCAAPPATRLIPEPAQSQAQPYVETVPGSAVTFTMRPVTVADEGRAARTVWFAETETTWDAYDVFYLRLDENAGNVAAAGLEGADAVTRPTQPYAPPDRGWGHGGYPAIGVTFHAATKYCEWLARKTGRRYRLPTEREFNQTWWGRMNRAADLTADELFWHAGNSDGTTHPVASLKQPSDDGLYDVVGNVAEWCVAEDGTPGVWGGSFLGDAGQLAAPEVRRQTRDWNASDPSLPKSKWWLRDAPFVGFRVVCDRPPR